MHQSRIKSKNRLYYFWRYRTQAINGKSSLSKPRINKAAARNSKQVVERWERNIKIGPKKWVIRVWSRFIWLKSESRFGFLRTLKLWIPQHLGISWPAELVSSTEEVLRWKELAENLSLIERNASYKGKERLGEHCCRATSPSFCMQPGESDIQMLSD
jgi:hypothetical protein